MPKIPCECSQQEFFAALAERTESVADQKWVSRSDGTVIRSIQPPKFKIWCRQSYGGPMLTGEVEENEGKIEVFWTTRPPWPVLLFYVIVACVIIFRQGTQGIIEGFEIVIFITVFIKILDWFQRSGVQKMVSILMECAQENRRQKSELRSSHHPPSFRAFSAAPGGPSDRRLCKRARWLPSCVPDRAPFRGSRNPAHTRVELRPFR